MLAETALCAVRGHKSVEVRLTRANKGVVVSRLTEEWPQPDFQLSAGDDRTDEDLFAQLEESALTSRVGHGPTRARFRLPARCARLAPRRALRCRCPHGHGPLAHVTMDPVAR